MVFHPFHILIVAFAVMSAASVILGVSIYARLHFSNGCTCRAALVDVAYIRHVYETFSNYQYHRLTNLSHGHLIQARAALHSSPIAIVPV